MIFIKPLLLYIISSIAIILYLKLLCMLYESATDGP